MRGGWLGVRGGLQFGLVLALASVAGVLGLAAMVAWPGALFFAIAVQQVVNGLLLGVMFGVVCRRAVPIPVG